MGSRFWAFASGASLAIAIACGSTKSEDTSSSSSGEIPPDPFADSGSDGTSGGPCVNLQCKQVQCPGGGTTSLSGKVTLPEGTIPVYNAIVYVPNAELTPFPPGVACDKCGTVQSGSPIATALTDAAGNFSLRNVPVGVDVPVVIQIGRWRRKILVPAANVAQCADRPLAAGDTRLPRSQGEGEIPRMAVATGDADALECFLLRLGVDPAEFTNPSGNGRIHLYRADGVVIDGNTPLASPALWGDATATGNLSSYDAVFMSCEGGEVNANKAVEARTRLKSYMEQGGRVFVSHYAYTWFKNNPDTAVRDTAAWTPVNTDLGTAQVRVDTSFPKAVDFDRWLDAAGATTAPGSKTLVVSALRRNITAVPAAGAPADRSRQWLYHTDGGTNEPKIYSFNMPIGVPAAQQCGRGVFTDIHITLGNNIANPFPSSCAPATTLSAQEKALAFLLMDLAACIQDDGVAPQPPPPVIN